MKMESTRLLFRLSTVFLILNICFNRANAAKLITHEDIRDAVLSLVHSYRDNTDKLERHEHRERQLGDHLKKMIGILDKRAANAENSIKLLTDTITRMEEKIDNMEKKIFENHNNKEKEMYTIDTIGDSMQTWISNIESKLKSPEQNSSQEIEKLNSIEKLLKDRIDLMTATLQRVESVVSQPDTAVDNVNNYEGVINRFEDKLVQLQNAPLEWRKHVDDKLDKQIMLLDQLKETTNDIATNVADLPKQDEVISIKNSTLDELEQLKYDFVRTNDNTIANIGGKLDNIKSESKNDYNNLMKSLTDSTSMSEGLYSAVEKSYDQLSNDVKALSKVEKVLIQTADNVLDTKRRIEYGTHQILLEVGDLIKTQGKDLNLTVNRRFDGISETIVENHNSGFNKLSSKIENEISKVWRQIGIMYQQLTASAGALDRLQNQTEQYVNGSIQTMGSMEGKVKTINEQMADVDGNLNYLLGRLSLVTQEFNQIKTGLGTALDNIKSSFHQVQDEVKSIGRGPQSIPEKKEENNNVVDN